MPMLVSKNATIAYRCRLAVRGKWMRLRRTGRHAYSKALFAASDGWPGLVLVKVTCAISKAARHSCPGPRNMSSRLRGTSQKKTISSTLEKKKIYIDACAMCPLLIHRYKKELIAITIMQWLAGHRIIVFMQVKARSTGFLYFIYFINSCGSCYSM